jgi:hypothetical protein
MYSSGIKIWQKNGLSKTEEQKHWQKNATLTTEVCSMVLERLDNRIQLLY